MYWLSQIQRWLKKLFRRKTKALRPQILKRVQGENCAVLRIERDTPSAIDTHRIVSIHLDYDILLTLDILSSINEDILGNFHGTSFRLRSSVGSRSSALTHRYAIFKILRNSRTIPVNIWDVDLQGSTGGILAAIAPTRAIAGVALLPILIPHNPPVQTWRSQVERIDWLGALKLRIREELGNPRHQLNAKEVPIVDD